jgi:hypothetical protein
MKLKINNVNFQRNGVHGEPFYAVHYTENKEEFLATFRTQPQDENIIDWTSCRVCCINKPIAAFRGDYIAGFLQSSLNAMRRKQKKESIYDLTDSVLLYSITPTT